MLTVRSPAATRACGSRPAPRGVDDSDAQLRHHDDACRSGIATHTGGRRHDRAEERLGLALLGCAYDTKLELDKGSG